MCSSFKTLANAETQFLVGLRSTSVGMCVCARHEIVRVGGGGVGDLQKGERLVINIRCDVAGLKMTPLIDIAIWTLFYFQPSSLLSSFRTTSLANSS